MISSAQLARKTFYSTCIPRNDAPVPYVSTAFLERALLAALHREPSRWNLLYRLLWRLQNNRELMRVEVDTDVSGLLRLVQQIKRDEHKMHAFVRFRRIADESGEQFIAWYEPAHRILSLAAPFFQERFAIMRWSILTPDGSVYWDPALGNPAVWPTARPQPRPRRRRTGDAVEELLQQHFQPGAPQP